MNIIEEKKVTMNMQYMLHSRNCIILFVTEIRSSTVREEPTPQNEYLSSGIDHLSLVSETTNAPIVFASGKLSVQTSQCGLVHSYSQ